MNEIASRQNLSKPIIYQNDKMGFYFCYKEYQACREVKDCGPNALGTSCNLTKDMCRKNFVSCIDIQRASNENAVELNPPPPPPLTPLGSSMPSAPPAAGSSSDATGSSMSSTPPGASFVGSVQGPSFAAPLTSGPSMPSAPPAQGPSFPAGPSGSGNPTGSTYTVYTPPVFPEQKLPPYTETYVPKSPTDINSEVNRILSNSSLTPTVRQNIRQEVSNALNKELYKLNNEYEIDYIYV